MSRNQEPGCSFAFDGFTKDVTTARKTLRSERLGILLLVWHKMSLASTLQTAFLNKALFDRRDVRLGITKRVRRRVDRVVAEDEIVLVRSGRGGRAPNRLPAHLGGPGRC